MIKIRPVSELRNSFPKIEELVVKQDETVYLTKNGTGIMVVMSIEKYSSLINAVGENSAISSKKSTRRTVKGTTSNKSASTKTSVDEDATLNDIDVLWKQKND